MMLRRLPAWFWVGFLLIVAATAVGVVLVFRFCSDSRCSPDELVRTLVTVVSTGGGLVGALWKRAQSKEAPRMPVERAADELAEQLRRQWERAAAERGLIRPTPISLRWQWSLQPVTGPITEAVQGSFAPLPTMAALTMEDLWGGTVEDLLRVYGGLGSGRLVVLGEPGAGKSGAGIRLLRDALAQRATVPEGDRARVPVPVLVTPAGWDPTTQPFAAWLAASLARDYALLRAPEYGEDAAGRLIEGGHLAVILDGFDEIPEALRPAALRALEVQDSFRLVVLTRTQEWVSVVSDGRHLQGAAALELQPIDSHQAAEYLVSVLINPLPDSWQHVVDHLREHPAGALAHALTTPLTLTLLRDTYGPGEAVDELLDAGRFATPEAIEDHLLDRVLPAAYTPHPDRPIPPYTVDQARRWLGQLAHRMNEDGTHDLAWWQIPRWVPAWPRAVATVTVMGLVSALLVWALAGCIAHTYFLTVVFHAGPSTQLIAVFAWALGYAFLFGPGLLLMSPPRGGFSPEPERPRWSRTDVLMILLLGVGVGAGFGLQNGLLYETKYGLESGLKYGLLIGMIHSFVVGLGFVLGGGPPQRLGWLRWNSTDKTSTNLRTGLVSGLVAGFVVGLGYWLGYGLKNGLEYGFVVGIGYLLVLVVGGRTSPQRSQVRWSRMTTPATLLIGLLIAIVTTGGYAIIYVFLVIRGGPLVRQRSQVRWSKMTTPATLLTGLLAGPVIWFGFGRIFTDNLGFALAMGLSVGLMAGLLLGLRPPMEAASPLDPQSLWRRERQGGLVVGLIMGLVVGLLYGLRNGLSYGLWDGLVYGLTSGFVAGLGSGLVTSATWAVVLANAQLRRRDNAPARLLQFLDDARQRQILRTVGPVYQFRDTRLQDRLAASVRDYVGTSPRGAHRPQIAAG